MNPRTSAAAGSATRQTWWAFTPMSPQRSVAARNLLSMLRSTLVFSLAFSLLACSRQPHPSSAPAAPAAADASAPRPNLVVLVVLDQLGSWVLEEHTPLLPSDGLLRTAMEQGVFYPVAEYGYAGTYTAPGHAAIASGAWPAESGVFSNQRWDAARGGVVSMVDDGTSAVFGVGGAFASPSVLRVRTVADSLKEVTGGRGHVVAISYKDRGAILPAGHRPDIALWYDSQIPGFTTSTYYASELPAWLVQWQAAHPLSAITGEWTPHDRKALAARGSDEAPGEGDWKGYGTSFPHAPERSQDPSSTLRASPGASEYLLELARAAVDAYDLGRDATPDLLILSISGTDYVGHTFGPSSWEYADNLVRVDRALGVFARQLRAEGPVAFVVTSDHGVAPLPEQSRAQGHVAGRIFEDEVAAEMEAMLDARLGRGDWIAAYAPPFIYLTAAALASPNRDQATKLLVQHLTALESIERAVDVRALAAPADPIATLVAASVPADAPGQIFVVPERYFVTDEAMPRGFGTSHGTPWEYDRQVPVLLWGAGIEHVRAAKPAAMTQVATTLAALLGVPAPATAAPEPLAGLSQQ